MSYGESFDFSSVILPGVGGQLNASNAISTDQLMKRNKEGKKWSPTPDGGMSMHNESLLKSNQVQREKRKNLINRDYNSYADGSDAMNEIMSRRKARILSHREIKKKEYNFADDTELLSMPQPFSQSSAKGCSSGCKGAGKCSCDSCSRSLSLDSKHREWPTDKRESLKEGKMKGGFAGPGTSFPISSPQDVSAAWSSVGRASNPREVMAKIIRIAIKNGWESGLPQTVRDRLKAGKSGLPEKND